MADRDRVLSEDDEVAQRRAYRYFRAQRWPLQDVSRGLRYAQTHGARTFEEFVEVAAGYALFAGRQRAIRTGASPSTPITKEKAC